jgi:hypothetical protein
LLVLPAITVAWWRAPEEARGTATIVLLFSGAAVLVIYPRPDEPRVAATITPLLAASAWLWARPPRSVRRARTLAGRAAIAVCLTVGLSGLIATRVATFPGGAIRRAALPHLRGVPIAPRDHALLEADVAALGTLVAAGAPAWLISHRAGLYYLLAGIRNPTPYDYPLITALGRTGQAGMIAALDRGAIPLVCVDRLRLPGDKTLWPAQVVEHVRRTMRLRGTAGAWTCFGATHGPSVRHTAEQPSPPATLPSSHSSPAAASVTPLPLYQAVRLGGEHHRCPRCACAAHLTPSVPDVGARFPSRRG